MLSETCSLSSQSKDPQAPYSGVPLLQVLRGMSRGDYAAWAEFHTRPLFHNPDGTLKPLVEHIGAMSQTYWAFRIAGNGQAADWAYDVALARFLAPCKAQVGCRRGVNSLRYVQAIERLATRAIAKMPQANPATHDIVVIETVRHSVMRSLRQACLEARRKVNPARSRYSWRTSRGRLTVWLPVDLRGSLRRDWLLKHVPDADPQRPGGRWRVQAIIDQYYGARVQARLDCCVATTLSRQTDGSPPAVLARKELADRQLPELVAEEKANCIAWQRPAIRALGTAALRSLVMTVFDSILAGHYDERKLARRYGLSAATMTRFAGSRWGKNPADPPPDLFLNLAHVVAMDDALVEAAQTAGVWHVVNRVLSTPFVPRLGRAHRAG